MATHTTMTFADPKTVYYNRLLNNEANGFSLQWCPHRLQMTIPAFLNSILYISPNVQTYFMNSMGTNSKSFPLLTNLPFIFDAGKRGMWLKIGQGKFSQVACLTACPSSDPNKANYLKYNLLATWHDRPTKTVLAYCICFHNSVRLSDAWARKCKTISNMWLPRLYRPFNCRKSSPLFSRSRLPSYACSK